MYFLLERGGWNGKVWGELRRVSPGAKGKGVEEILCGFDYSFQIRPIDR